MAELSHRNGSRRVQPDQQRFRHERNFSKVVGTHSLKFGAQLEYDQIDTHPLAFLNGSFDINGSETGLAFADFLLGITSEYTQNQLRAFYGRNKYVGLYAQDSWRVTHNLTLNYGLRWDRIEPWYEKYNNNITFIPGEQSVVFPTAPTGIVYPGDPGVRARWRPRETRISPRASAWHIRPTCAPDSLLGKILGGPGKTSIRAGFGIFYAAIPGETLGLVSDNPPYGYTFQNAANPLLATPFIDGDTGNVEGQRFPAQLAPLNVSPSNPDPNIDFSQFEPIGATPGYKTTNTIPYTEEYMLSLQRQIGTNTLVSVGYVGNQGPSSSRARGSQSWQSRAVPEPAWMRSRRREQRIHQRFRANGQRNARAFGSRFRQRQLPGDDWQFQLQRPGSQRAPHQRASCNCFSATPTANPSTWVRISATRWTHSIRTFSEGFPPSI